MQRTAGVRGALYLDDYDWEEDARPAVPMHRTVAYSLHVRGFTKHASSRVRHRGTFAGLTEKIPYLTELGINQIQCMPVYEFEPSPKYLNYWGYGPRVLLCAPGVLRGRRSGSRS